MTLWQEQLPDHPRIVIWNGVSRAKQLKTKRGIDKVSMKEQAATGHAFVEQMNGVLVAEFNWDGESRWESDLEKALADFSKQGKLHYHQLRDMWRTRSFDILHCYHHSRLGRSFTLQSWVVENVVRSGALIYEHLGGWIDENNYPGKIAINGFSNVSEIRRFTSLTAAARKERPRRGLHAVRLPFTHVAEYDPVTGEQVRIVVNPERRQMMYDLAELVLEGHGWMQIPRLLAERGHVNPSTGGLYHPTDLARLMYHPVTFGHLLETNLHRDGGAHFRIALWRIDPSEPPPPGAVIHYNTHEPMFDGPLAERLLAELRRRTTVKGQQRPHKSRMFSGLCICAECLYRMRTTTNTYKDRAYTYIECVSDTRHKMTGFKTPCANNKNVRYEDLQLELDAMLRACLEEAGHLDELFAAEDQDDAARRLEQVQADIEAEEKRVRALIMQRADAPETLSTFYAEAIKEADARLRSLQTEAGRLKVVRDESAAERSRRAAALGSIGDVIDEFWTLPENEINQHLHAFFLNYRLYILGGKIVRLAPAPPRQR